MQIRRTQSPYMYVGDLLERPLHLELGWSPVEAMETLISAASFSATYESAGLCLLPAKC